MCDAQSCFAYAYSIIAGNHDVELPKSLQTLSKIYIIYILSYA